MSSSVPLSGTGGDDAALDILLTEFEGGDEAELKAAIGRMGQSASSGDAVNNGQAKYVFAAAYDEPSLRSHRAAALDERRPWCFCVHHDDRNLVAAASVAREGRMLLLPPDERELKRLFTALGDDYRERSSGDALFSGLDRLEASFRWKTSQIDVSRVCRRVAKILAEAGFYPDRGEEDECALALEEAIVNSTEHGNLELDSSLRPDDLLAEDLYETERQRRMADPAYGDRKVVVGLRITAAEATVDLSDEGKGFDVSKVNEDPSGLEVSGKGFWLIKRPFDAATYNATGTRLTLVKRRPGS
ncbi:MAG TPA: ATP-binding protein [Rectinemataceae bacterium]|nr:ATP-binding protein [Rectinemataceae bacterium]